MEHFREIYDDELKNLGMSITELDLTIFNHHDTRAFVYEVCKRINRKSFITDKAVMTDKEFADLQAEIKTAWKDYDRLQKIYEKQTGKRLVWLK